MPARSRARQLAASVFGVAAVIVHLVLAEAATRPSDLPLFTDLSDLREAAAAGQRILCRVRFEAVVLLADARGERLVLQDASGAASLQTDGLVFPFRPGDQIRISALGEVSTRGFRFRRGLEVDNDGLHAVMEESGEVTLKAGRYPFRVDWFNGTTDQVLEVYWAGPDLPRQQIPSSAFCRLAVDPASGVTNWLNGLDYRAYEGNWAQLPAFRRLNPVKQGIAKTPDCDLSTATNFAGLAFSGFLEVPRDGRYTFSVVSDDGARLCLDAEPPAWEVLATHVLPAPRRIAIGQSLGESEDCEWSQAEGRVTFLNETDAGLELELLSVAGRLTVLVAEAGDIPRALLMNSRVQVAGSCRSTFTTDGARLAGPLWSPGSQQVEILEVAPALWRDYPVVPIGSVLTNAPGDTNTLVHVRGRIRLDPGSNGRTLRDRTGQLRLEINQSLQPEEGSRIEALGQPCWTGTNFSLRGAVYRVITPSQAATNQADANAEELPLLTTVEEVKGLSRAEAERGYPVRLRGVVTALMEVGFFFQDSTWSIYVSWETPPGGVTAQVGEYWEVEGNTYALFAPNVQAHRAQRLGDGRLPQPLHPTWDQLINGSLDTQYIEIEGVIVSMTGEVATLLTRAGKIKVELINVPAGTLARHENARVRLRGCFMPERDEVTQQLIVGKIYLANSSISVDEPAPADPFTARLKSTSDLLMFDPQASSLQRVRVQGVVIHERAGEYFLMDGTNGFRLVAREAIRFQPGDLVDVVGFPELGGPSPVLRNAVVRRAGRSTVPEPRQLTAEHLLSNQNDATRVRIESRLLSTRSSETDQVLELQAGTRSFVARLPANFNAIPSPPIGSLVELTGVYAGQGGDRMGGRGIDSFELLLASPADIVVVERPPWWTVQRMVSALGLLATVLLLAAAWITALRRQVERQTRKLKEEIEERKRAEVDLAEKARQLRAEIEERKRAEQEVEHIHQQLLTASHQAGMAEVATNVLHNVGNVLNSVNVSASVIARAVRHSKTSQIPKLAALLAEHAQQPDFLLSHEKGRQVPGYLHTLGEQLAEEQRANLAEIESLRRHIEHIESIVQMQQNYARLGGVREVIRVREIMEDALKLSAETLTRDGVRLEREFAADPQITVEKHKLLQILVNLLQNAKHACTASARPDPRIRVRIVQDEAQLLRLEVADNGVGIAPEHLARIFTQGFTTRKDGHGFGLHGCILATKEMGGNLAVHSDGPGTGATFTLLLPLQPEPNSAG